MSQKLARSFNMWRVSAAASSTHLIKHMLNELEASENRARRRSRPARTALSTTMITLLLDLFVALEANPERWLTLSRNSNNYSTKKHSPYVNPQVTYRAIQACVKFLSDPSYIECLNGFWDWSSNVKMRTKIRPTEKLLGLLGEYGVRGCDVQTSDKAPVLILKANKKDLQPYQLPPATRKTEANLRSLNRFLSRFTIGLDMTSDEIAEMKQQRLKEQLEALHDPYQSDGKPDIVLPNTRMYRVFNNGTFKLGGRFYGPWWQTIPRDLRHNIIIDGEDTVELDFQAMHPRMLYHLEGIDLCDNLDPYSMGGLAEYPREIVKKVFNQLLNAKDESKLSIDAGLLLAHDTDLEFWEIATGIHKEHSQIDHRFLSGMGLKLMNLDSRIAEKVMVKAMDKGFPALSIHDSFIAPTSCHTELLECMHEGYQEVMGFIGVIDNKGGHKVA